MHLLVVGAVERQNIVESFAEDTMVRQSLMVTCQSPSHTDYTLVIQEYLKRVPDMDRMAKKFSSRKAGLQVCNQSLSAPSTKFTLCCQYSPM